MATIKNSLKSKRIQYWMGSLALLIGVNTLLSSFSTDAFTYGSWSEWSETKPADAFGRVIESKTQYMYRDKEFKNHTASTLSGWTPTGKAWDELSAWKITKYIRNDDCKTSPTTYSNYVTGNQGSHALTSHSSTKSGYWYDRAVSDAGWNMYTAPAGYSMTYCGVSGLTHKYQEESPTVKWKTWTYAWVEWSRTLTKWWEFWRWQNNGAWNYQWTQPAANANREIKSRTVYRYKDIADTTPPTGKCWLGEKRGGEAYETVCQAWDENSGIKSIRFKTWPSSLGEGNAKWFDGGIHESTTTSDGVYSYVQMGRFNRISEWNNKLDYYNTKVYATDMKGNESLIGTFTNIDLRDITPPTTSLTKTPNATWTNQTTSVKITATDNAGGTGIKTVQYSTDNQNWTTVSNNHTLSFSQPGTYTVYARSSDYSDNWSSTVSTTVKIDQTKPTITPVQVNPSGWTNQPIYLTSTGSDSGGSGFKRFEYKIEELTNTWHQSPGSSFNYPITAYGTYTIHVRGRDEAGNYSDTQTVYAYLDNNAPRLTVSQEITDLTTKFYNLTATASDTISSISKIQLPNGNYVYSSTADYFITQNGTYTFKAWDQAGNTTTRSITVNNIKPIQDGEDSPVGLYYQSTGATNSSGWVPIVDGGSVVFSNEGTSTLTAEARDEAGNKSPQKQTTIKIDKTKPTLSATHNTAWTNQSVPITVTAKDNVGLHSVNTFKGSLNMKDFIDAKNLGSSAKVLFVYDSNQENSPVWEIQNHINQTKAELEKLGMTVTVIPESQFPSHSVDQYQVIIGGGYWWSLKWTTNSKLNEAYAKGISILTFGDDINKDHPLISSSTSDRYDSVLVGTSEGHFLSDFIIRNRGTSWTTKIMKLAKSQTKVLGELQYGDGTSAPGLLLDRNTKGAQWIHFQVAHEPLTEVLPKAVTYLAQRQMSLTPSTTHQFTATENGDYYISAYDIAGNRQTLQYRVSNIDQNKPKININISPSGWTNTDVVVDIYASDSESGVQGLEYELTGATVKSVTQVSQDHVRFTITNTGTTTIRARATDVAGNKSDWVSGHAYVDKKAPVIDSFKATPTLTNQSDVRLKVVARDDHSGVVFKRYKRNNEEWRSWSAYHIDEAALTIPIREEGLNTFYAQVRDLAGNVSEVVSAQVIYDITGPEILSVEVAPYYTNYNKIQVKVQAKDNFQDDGWTSVARIEVSNDGQSWTSYDAPTGELILNEWTIPLVNGYRNLYVRAYDNLGNVGATQTVEYVVDTIAPTGSIVIENGEIYVPDEITLTLQYKDVLNGIDGLSGVEKIEIFDVGSNYSHTIENPTGNTLKVPWVLTSYEAPDGLYKAKVGLRIWDRAGNLTTVYSQEVVLMRIIVDEFYLTDVVNPKVYGKNNPFKPLRYPDIPSQPLLKKGSFSFDAEYTYPKVIPAGWKLNALIHVTYIDSNGKETVRTHTLKNITVDGLLSFREIIPEDKTVGTEVYLNIDFIFENGTETINAGSFPRVTRTQLKIGEIEGDIREMLMFNEFN